MRGIPVIQVPTTLLAMVDSGIGGKTGLDTPKGKNLVGAFHQPRAVVADMAVLRTLPQREVNNGMAEIIKAGAIADEALFERCEALADAVQRKEMRALEELVAAAAAVKCRVVTADEKEGGLRAILNFGHTIGHGIEAVMAPRWLHGECVAVGMVKEAEAARALGVCHDGPGVVGRLRTVLRAYKLPVRVPAEARVDKVMRFMANDKKNTAASDRSGAPRRLADEWAAAGEAAPPPTASLSGVDTDTGAWSAGRGFSWASGDVFLRPGLKVRCVLLEAIGRVRSPPHAHPVPHALLARLCAQQVAVGIPVGLSRDPVRLRVPGSKSLSNRVLLLAGLAKGTTCVRGLLQSDDTQVMMRALEAVGAHLRWQGTDLLVTGTAGRPALTEAATGGSSGGGSDEAVTIWVRNAGTAARFLTAALCLLPRVDSAARAGRPVRLDGNERMRLRPIAPLVSALKAAGARVEHELEGSGALPLLIRGGGIPGKTVRLAAKLSSQYVSAVLMASPCAAEAGGSVELVLEEEHPTSLPYIRMTLAVMRQFGAVVDELAPNHYRVHAGHYTPPSPASAGATPAGADGVIDVEPDASTASYPAALAPATGRVVVVEGVGTGSLQGDAGFVDVLATLGCGVDRLHAESTVTPPGVAPSGSAAAASAGPSVVPIGAGLKSGGTVDMADVTDTFLTAAAIAPLCQPTADAAATTIVGIANQRVKECDRIAALATELAKCGAGVAELPEGLVLNGSGIKPLHGATVHCYDDHRVAMSLAVLGAALSCSRRSVAEPDSAAFEPVVLDDPLCVEKTFPEFWDMLERDFGVPVLAAGPGTSIGAAGTGIMAAEGVAGGSDVRSVVVIGMRGAGKTMLSRAVASRLSGLWRMVDVDDCIRAGAGGKAAQEIVSEQGWPGFREREVSALKACLRRPPTRTVIACGGGVIETEAARQALRAAAHPVTGGHIVLFLDRDVAAIVKDLGLDPAQARLGGTAAAASAADAGRPAYAGGETLAQAWQRRYPLYLQCCSHRVTVAPVSEESGADGAAAWESVVQSAMATLRTAGVAVDRLAVPGVDFTPRSQRSSLLATATKGDAAADAACLKLLDAAEPDVLAALSDPGRAALSPGSFFASFTLPDLSHAHALGADSGASDRDTATLRVLQRIARGSDAIELRADLFAPYCSAPASAASHGEEPLLVCGVDPHWLSASGASVSPLDAEAAATRFALAQLAWARRACPDKPIVWTVRSHREGGKFRGTDAAAARLLCAGVAAGAEFVDAELGLADEALASVFAAARGAATAGRSSLCRVIVSRHWPRAEKQPSPRQLEAACAGALAKGSDPTGRGADVIKLVTLARTSDDVFALRSACLPVLQALQRPGILLAMGPHGRLSRVLNQVLTPATSSVLPTAAAPGQLTVQQLQEHRQALGLTVGLACNGSRQFNLFGNPISLSPSPAMHNAAFKAAHLPHEYGLVETLDPRQVADTITAPSAGGGSVTMPLKRQLQDLCVAAVTDQVVAIGALNTLATREVVSPADGSVQRLVVGQNTDWLGIALPMAKALRERAAPGLAAQELELASAVASDDATPAVSKPARPCGLVIGAGATARSAVYALHRLGLRVCVWNRTASKAAALASATGAMAIAHLEDASAAESSVDCIVCAVPASAGMTVPAALLASKPVVLDVAYIPRDTELIKQAEAAGCAVVAGLEMLVAQGVGQQIVWTGRLPAAADMAAAATLAHAAATETLRSAAASGSA
jgi:pentafunctional AROM polypeptide